MWHGEILRRTPRRHTYTRTLTRWDDVTSETRSSRRHPPIPMRARDQKIECPPLLAFVSLTTSWPSNRIQTSKKIRNVGHPNPDNWNEHVAMSILGTSKTCCDGIWPPTLPRNSRNRALLLAPTTSLNFMIFCFIFSYFKIFVKPRS